MTNARYRTGNHCAATATALLLSLPSIAEPAQNTINPTTAVEYQALGEAGARVADAVIPSVYAPASSEALASLLLEAATRLLSQSKSLDPDFSAVVDREFWNLL